MQGNNSIIAYLGTVKGAVTVSIILLIIVSVMMTTRVLQISVFGIVHRAIAGLLKVVNKFIGVKETKYKRELAIGKIDEKRRKVRIYRFFNYLIIDLNLKQIGATPYEFLFLCIVGSAIITLIICQVLFANLWMSIIMFPIVFAAVICILYTKANVAHDDRIEAIIEAENIICNNIKDGVIVAIRNSINVMPNKIRGVFKDFLDNIEHKNYHVKTALLELNNQLGSTADDFIRKCIVYELEEEHGIVDMFQDIVEMNNIKMEMRIEMKREFEKITTDFIIGASMIIAFLAGVLAIYPAIAKFYLKTSIGQIIIAIDALLLIARFVYITYLRAKEL